MLDKHAVTTGIFRMLIPWFVFIPLPSSLKVWRTSTCDLVHTLRGHKEGVMCLQSRGYHVVSGSYDDTIRSALGWPPVRILKGCRFSVLYLPVLNGFKWTNNFIALHVCWAYTYYVCFSFPEYGKFSVELVWRYWRGTIAWSGKLHATCVLNLPLR